MPTLIKTSSFARKLSPMEISRILEACFHAPLSYCYGVTSYTSLMLPDIDECSNGSHNCDVNVNCTNTNGSHSCTCKEGYTGKGESCQGKIKLGLEKSRKPFITSNCLVIQQTGQHIFFSIQLLFANLL